MGGQVRFLVTGREAQTIRFRYTNAQGATISNLPVATKFYPALAAAWLGKPRWLFAFLGGVIAGALVDDRYERLLLERVLGHVSAKSEVYEAA